MTILVILVLPNLRDIMKAGIKDLEPVRSLGLCYQDEVRQWKTSAYMTMLDAKSAFDVVVKDILMRKTFFSEVEPAA